MHKVLNPWDDVDRVYVSRKEGGGGLTSIQDGVVALIQWLYKNDNSSINRTKITRKQLLKKPTERIFQATNKQNIIRKYLDEAEKKCKF